MRLLCQKLSSLSLITAAVVFAPACSSGTSSGGSGPGAVSSVEPSKTGGSLSEAEAKQYCEDTRNFSKAQLSEADLKKVGCGVVAVFYAGFSAKTDAEAKTECAKQYDTCLSEPAGTRDGGAAKDPCAGTKAALKDCAATISELNTCTADNAAAFKALVGKDFCAGAKAAAPGDAGAPSALPFEQPASCKALAAKCPNLNKTDG